MTPAAKKSSADTPEDETSALTATIYAELRSLAAHYMRAERPGHTLRPTDLVHEAYLRISRETSPWQNRSQFFAMCATTMRRVLVDYARQRGAAKRQLAPGEKPAWLASTISVDHPEDLLALDQALTKLAEIDPRQSRIVELRFFGGLAVREISETLEIPTTTLKRELTLARAWLFREIGGSHVGRPQ